MPKSCAARRDSTLYEHAAMTWMDENAIRYAISVRMGQQIKECVEALPENHWKPAGEDIDAIRAWAELNYVHAGPPASALRRARAV